MAWESHEEPDEYDRQGQTGPMPEWGGPDATGAGGGHSQQDRVPPGFGYGDAPPPGYYPPGYVPPGYLPPGYGPPGYLPNGYMAVPGWGPGYFMPGPLPNSHLVRAIVSIFMFWPLGLAAIIMATQVEGRYRRGDYYGAVQASRSAKVCANIALGVGIFFIGIAMLGFLLIASDVAGSGASGLALLRA